MRGVDARTRNDTNSIERDVAKRNLITCIYSNQRTATADLHASLIHSQNRTALCVCVCGAHFDPNNNNNKRNKSRMEMLFLFFHHHHPHRHRHTALYSFSQCTKSIHPNDATCLWLSSSSFPPTFNVEFFVVFVCLFFFSYFLSFFPSAFAYTYHIHIRFCIDADVRRQRVPNPAAALLTATGAIERVATHCTYCAFVRTFIEWKHHECWPNIYMHANCM